MQRSINESINIVVIRPCQNFSDQPFWWRATKTMNMSKLVFLLLTLSSNKDYFRWKQSVDRRWSLTLFSSLNCIYWLCWYFTKCPTSLLLWCHPLPPCLLTSWRLIGWAVQPRYLKGVKTILFPLWSTHLGHRVDCCSLDVLLSVMYLNCITCLLQVCVLLTWRSWGFSPVLSPPFEWALQHKLQNGF